MGRCVEWVVEPVTQVAIGKEVEPEHGGEIGQGPARLREVMQPLKQEQGEQGCPNLDAERILTGSHECFNLQILLERLEK